MHRRKRLRARRAGLALALLMVALACGQATQSAEPSPAPASLRDDHVDEASLATVSLTPEATRRLGVETVSAEVRMLESPRRLAGEVIPPPGRTVTIAAPLAGLVDADDLPLPGDQVAADQVLARLVPIATVDRDLRAQAKSGIATARARLTAGESRARRAEALIVTGAGSERAAEDARVERDVAAAELEAARARLRMIERAPLSSDVAWRLKAPFAAVVRQVLVADGQSVAGGAPLVELVALDPPWVRVSVPVVELAAIADGPAEVARLGRHAPSVAAAQTAGPPIADPIAGTVDRFYALAEAGSFHLGERVRVDLPGVAAESVCVPASALLVDVHGGDWVYVQVREDSYDRRRVVVDRVRGGIAALSRGVEAGDVVVSVGAAELFGIEFGAGH